MHLVACPVIVGRDGELAVLESRLAAARAGQGCVALVSGEAGVGKSRLVREVQERAAALGMVVARGRAVPDAVRVPFRALAEATHAALRETPVPFAPELLPLRAMLGPFVPDWEGPGRGPSEGEAVVLEAIVRLLRAIAAERGLLLVLEDVQWADRSTLAAIEYAADALRASKVCCICTERAHAGGPTADVIARLTTSRAAERVQLERLGEDDVVTMARLALGVETLPAAVFEVLQRRAEGLPFLVEELLSAYMSAGESSHATAEWRLARRVAETIPSSFHELLRVRLNTLDAAARRCVQAAAILGRTFDWRLVAPITGSTSDEVLAALRAAVFEQVLVASGDADADAFSFRHALVREAVLAELLPPERTQLSLTAAEVIEDNRPGLPGEWCDRAAELRDQAGDSLGACRLLQESARRALARGALESAEATLRRARDLAFGDHMLWIGTDWLLSEVLAQAGKTSELVELSKTVVASLQTILDRAPTSFARLMMGPRMAEFHLQVARGAIVALDPALAREHLAQARRLAEDDEMMHLHIRLLSANLALDGGDSRSALAHGKTCLDAADRLAAKDLVPEALDVIGRALEQEGDLDGAVMVFQRLDNEAVNLRAPVWRIRALEELGAIQTLRESDDTELEAARTLAIETGAVSALASINLQLGWHRLARPSFDEAEAFIEEAVEAARAFSLPTLGDALVARAASFALSNRSRDMRRSVGEALRVARGRPDIEASALAEGEAVLALVREDRPAAREALETAVHTAARWRRGTPWWFGLRVLLRAVDDISAGGDLVAPASANPVGHACVLYGRAVQEGRRGQAGEAITALAAADAAMPEGWKRHLCHRLLGEAAVSAGWGDPGAWARDALGFFDGLGMAAIANACKRVMRQAGVAVPRAGRGESAVPAVIAALGITRREMDVLALVAEGLSNGEIGTRLFLSPRTIETHVASLTRKAQVGNRVQLVALAARLLTELDTT